MSNKKQKSKSKLSSKSKAAIDTKSSAPNTNQTLEKRPEKSPFNRTRRVPAQYFRRFAILLLLTISCLFFAIVQLENEGVMSMGVHYAYVISILLSFSMPLLGLFLVKRYQ